MLHILPMTVSRKIDVNRGERIKRVRNEFLKLSSQIALAELLTDQGKPVTRGAVGNWEQGKDVGLESLTALAELAGVSLDWLAYGKGEPKGDGPSDAATETAQTPNRPKPNASFPPRFQRFSQQHTIPLMGQSEAGPNGKFIMNGQKVADVFCPPGLENVPNAYAVRVYGTSMEPRYRAGETVWLNPQVPVRSGDDVVVQLKAKADGDEMASYIKEFRSRSSKLLRLWQHNPEDGESKELEFDNDDVFSVHKVVHHATV